VKNVYSLRLRMIFQQRSFKEYMTTIPKFIAHRGESYDAPENTLAAVNLAWERGAQSVEVDVHLTADGRFCVIHDYDTRRTTGKNLIVRKATLSQLRQLEAGAWKGSRWAGESIPSLLQVTETVPDHGTLVVEIKPWLAEVDTFVKEINNSPLRHDQVEVISFNLDTLARVKRKLPEIKMLWLFETRSKWCQYLRRRNPGAIKSRLRRHKLNGVNVGDSHFLTEEYIKTFTSAGFPVYVYTVNDPARAQQLIRWGVEAVTTDRAAWMNNELHYDKAIPYKK
jgi:glycerophosphoryl diester phosphodiesterase